MKSKLLVFALIFVLVFALAACGGGSSPAPGGGDDGDFGSETFFWRSQTFTGTGTMYHDLHLNLANTIEEMSGGRLQIQVFGSGEIVQAFDMPNAVRDGVLDSIMQATSQWTLEYAAPLFCSTPGEFPDPHDQVFWLRFGGGWEIFEDMTNQFGVKTFIGGITHAENFLWAPFPVTRVEDLQGLSIRMMPVGGDILARNGVSVVFMPGGEIVPAIERGVIDAAEFAVSSMDLTLGFHDVAKYYHKPGWHQPSLLLEYTINGDSWNALPADLQKIVEIAAWYNTSWSTMYSAVRNVAAEEYFKNNGNELVWLDATFINQLSEWKDEYFEEMEASDPYFRRIRESQRNFMQWWQPNKDMLAIDPPPWSYDTIDRHPYALVPRS